MYDIFFSVKHINQPISEFRNMNLSIIIFAAAVAAISQLNQIHSQNSMDRPLLRVRNQYLRFYIYAKKETRNDNVFGVGPVFKHCILAASTTIKDKTTRIYNKVLSKYYDAHAAYYSLPQEDRDIIEQIINLYF